MKTIDIDLERIEQNENSRVHYKTEDLHELMASLKKDGLLQPVGVRLLKPGAYEAVFGNRRLLAARKLGWASIAATVVEAPNEVDRDVLNMIENLKRRNTTVNEDGRGFLLLRGYGLTDSEIAARVGVPLNRVRVAIEVSEGVPIEFRDKVHNRAYAPGGVKGGKISASTAHVVMKAASDFGLTGQDKRALYALASKDHVPAVAVRQIAPLLKAGMPVKDACERISEFQVVAVNLLMSRTNVAAIEKKYKTSVASVILAFLERHPDFDSLKINQQRGRKLRSGKMYAPATLSA